MMSRTPVRGSWIITVAIAAGAVAYVLLVFLPGRQTARELESQIAERQECLAHAQSIGTALAAAEEELRLARQYRDRWRQGAPSATHLSDLYARIHQLEKQSGVRTTRFDPQPIVPKESITEVPVSIGWVGTFGDVCRLLHGLERIPAAIWVQKIHIEKAAGTAKHVQCQADLVIFADNREKSDYAEKSD
ncbi:MAG: type 4a pilus biogenesis protein PilO [Thermoguttaceae bacterium]